MVDTSTAPSKPALLKVPEAARYLGLGVAAVYRMVNAEQIPSVRLGRAVRIPLDALDAWLAAQVRQPTQPPLGRAGNGRQG